MTREERIRICRYYRGDDVREEQPIFFWEAEQFFCNQVTDIIKSTRVPDNIINRYGLPADLFTCLYAVYEHISSHNGVYVPSDSGFNKFMLKYLTQQ